MGHQRRRQMVRIEPVDGPLRERAFDFIEGQHMPTAPLAKRTTKLTCEVETGYGEDMSGTESKRCYLCNLKYQIDVDNCIYCRACIEVAPKNCIKLVEGVEIREDGTYGELRETRQWDEVGAIWIDNNECIRCGACFMVCPTKCISITRNEFVTQDI
jgi:formate dehydrogenase major subunit